jgi:hypothetical protein
MCGQVARSGGRSWLRRRGRPSGDGAAHACGIILPGFGP